MKEENLDELKREINTAKVLGVENYGLTQSDVDSENFGSHTLEAMDKLLGKTRIKANPFNEEEESYEIRNYRQAFDLVKGLDGTQAEGVSKHELTRDDVNTENFGSHTLEAIISLKSIVGNDISDKQLFEYVKTLDEHQTAGFVEFGIYLDLETEFSKKILDTMRDLKNAIPNLSDFSGMKLSKLQSHIYRTAMNMLPEQRELILSKEVTLEQIGYEFSGDCFVQKDTNNEYSQLQNITLARLTDVNSSNTQYNLDSLSNYSKRSHSKRNEVQETDNKKTKVKNKKRNGRKTP